MHAGERPNRQARSSSGAHPSLMSGRWATALALDLSAPTGSLAERSKVRREVDRAREPNRPAGPVAPDAAALSPE